MLEEELEHRRHEVDVVTPLAAISSPVGGILVAAGAGQDQARAGQERQKNSHNRDSKLNGVFWSTRRRGSSEGLLHPEQPVDEPAWL